MSHTDEHAAAQQLTALGFTVVDVSKQTAAERKRWWICPFHGNTQRTHLGCRTCQLRHQVGLEPEASWEQVLQARAQITADLGGRPIDWESK